MTHIKIHRSEFIKNNGYIINMEDMIKMLTDVPEEQSLQMVSDRVKMIAGPPDEQRIQLEVGLSSLLFNLIASSSSLFEWL